ncbi:hypothetical protein [Rhodococcus sp. OK519]|uniref:hypothetical protein n=1 Tax=Rhodococcus sp. OK519 TaxID=2135729 RepID=UPI0015E67A6F
MNWTPFRTSGWAEAGTTAVPNIIEAARAITPSAALIGLWTVRLRDRWCPVVVIVVLPSLVVSAGVKTVKSRDRTRKRIENRMVGPTNSHHNSENEGFSGHETSLAGNGQHLQIAAAHGCPGTPRSSQ